MSPPLYAMLFSATLACKPRPAPATDSPMSTAGEAAGDAETGGPMVASVELGYDPPPGASDELATLDLYWIDDGAARPLALLVHGGSWVSGDKSNFDVAAPDFIPWWLERGYAVAAVNFRLADPVGQTLEVGPGEQALDLAYALAWLDANAETYALDTTSTVALGYSSGAHLVALLGTDDRYLGDAGLSTDTLAATISLDVHAYDVPFALELMVGSEIEANIPLIEHLFGEAEADQRALSPIAYVEGWAAPSLIVSVGPSSQEGTHGYIVDQTAARYVEALQAQGHAAERLHDEGETHDSLAIGFGAAGDAATAAVGDFLDGLSGR